MIDKCPGQDTRFWGPNDIYTAECPTCGHPVEFFKDDIRRRCQKCGHRFLNPKLNLGCARWCQYADQCVGEIGKEEFKDIIISGMKEHFDGDQEKIDHALKLLEFAEKILEKKKGNPKVVIGAASLYDIGLCGEEGERERHSGSHQGKDSLSTVRDILERSGSKEEVIEEVCQIIEGHYHPDKIDTLNSKIIYDAARLANLGHEYDIYNKEKLRKLISRVFLTDTGKNIAEKIYL